MNKYEIQMERAHQAAKAKTAAGELVEALRVATTMTRALVEDSPPHADIIEADTLHLNAQDLCARVVRFASGAGISGLPGGPVELPPRAGG